MTSHSAHVTDPALSCYVNLDRAIQCTDVPRLTDRPSDYDEAVQRVCR